MPGQPRKCRFLFFDFKLPWDLRCCSTGPTFVLSSSEGLNAQSGIPATLDTAECWAQVETRSNPGCPLCQTRQPMNVRVRMNLSVTRCPNLPLYNLFWGCCCVCVRACVRACVPACVSACVRACLRVCVRSSCMRSISKIRAFKSCVSA